MMMMRGLLQGFDIAWIITSYRGSILLGLLQDYHIGWDGDCTQGWGGGVGGWE